MTDDSISKFWRAQIAYFESIKKQKVIIKVRCVYFSC